MVVVVQLVRTPDCGSGGRRFESGLPPKFLNDRIFFYMPILLGKSIKISGSFYIKSIIYRGL